MDWQIEATARKQNLKTAIEEAGLTVTSVFVPWSKSRSYVAGADPSKRSLNWRVSIMRPTSDRPVLTTDYTAGIGHSPAYQAHVPGTLRWTIRMVDAIEFETETGRTARLVSVLGPLPGAPIHPDPVDVIVSLLNDADVLDYAIFEDWAPEIGIDPDSRKGEAIYRECLAHALALRAVLGDVKLTELRELAREY
jgi:hypothetical protein